MTAPPDHFRLIGATRDEVRAFFASLPVGHAARVPDHATRGPRVATSEPAYRADQVLRWVYGAGVADFEAMTNLAKPLRATLAERAVLHTTSVADVRSSRDGTRKLLVALDDGERVEAVVIPKGPRRTVCVSTQVGCPVGCAFCASGLDGLVRNLTAGEIVEQALHARRAVEPPATLTNVVVMGIGEPLLNYAALAAALRIVVAPWGLAMSPRRVTVSTVGIPDRIRDLAAEGLGVNLAVSLHAADDLTRRRLIPGARSLTDVAAAARDYLHATAREVTFEYALVRDVNDSPDDARGLADLVGREDILVNLLPLNRVAGLPWEEPPPARVERFIAELQRRGVRAVKRRRRGDDIEGACGQLRRGRKQ